MRMLNIGTVSIAMQWSVCISVSYTHLGDKMLPPGHGFGGITGKVGIKVCNAVYVADIYMQNTPQITTANAILTWKNSCGLPFFYPIFCIHDCLVFLHPLAKKRLKE